MSAAMMIEARNTGQVTPQVGILAGDVTKMTFLSGCFEGGPALQGKKRGTASKIERETLAEVADAVRASVMSSHHDLYRQAEIAGFLL